MVTFQKVNSFQYFCKNHEELLQEVQKTVEELTGGVEMLREHIVATTELLYITVLTRVVAREFFKQIPSLPDNILTVLVDVSKDDTIYTVCLGKSLDVEDGKEKIISSYYIK